MIELPNLASLSNDKFKEETQKGPRKVQVRFKINDIVRITEHNGTAEIDLVYYQSWVEPSLQKQPDFSKTVAEYEALWNPKLEIHNSLTLAPQWSKESSWKNSQGEMVMHTQRYRGMISHRFMLADFPFDSHMLEVETGSESMDSALVLLEIDPNHAKKPLDCPHKLDEWDIMHVRQVTLMGPPSSRTGRAYSNALLHVVISRKSGFYLWKIFFIQNLMSIWSWVTFFMDPRAFEDRMTIILTLFLASVAFLFVINDKLPRIPYLTIMDRATIASFFMLFLVAVENFAAYLLAERFSEEQKAHLVDYFCRYLFPMAHCVFVVGTMLFGYLRAQVNLRRHIQSC